MDVVQFLLFVLAAAAWRAQSALQSMLSTLHLIGEMTLEDADPRKADTEHREGWRKRLRAIKAV